MHSPSANDDARPLCYASRAVGLILDLAVVVLALTVLISLAMLAWTLAVSSVRATRQGRRRVNEARRSVTLAEQRLQAAAADATTNLADLVARTAPGDEPDR